MMSGAATIQSLAFAILGRQVDASWDDFFVSLVGAMPKEMRFRPRLSGVVHPLSNTRFIPTQDGRLLSGNETATIFFQPVRGVTLPPSSLAMYPRC
jgi:hypothetical protein